LATPLLAQKSAPQPPVPVVQAPAPAAPVAPTTENQRLYGPGQATLVSREAAEAVLKKFRETYVNQEAPRVVIYVNRELVDLDSGLKLSGHTEHYEQTESQTHSDVTPPAATNGAPQVQVNVGGATNASSGAPAGPGTTSSTTTRTTGENTYTTTDRNAPTLADRQTVRDIERLFGRVFRNAGARLADQQVAAATLADEPGQRLVGAQAARERAALAKVADVAVEVLISSKNLTVPGVSGDQTYNVPDIQATAIRLSDAAILGQASASDVLGRDRDAGRIVRQFDVPEITEAVALALVEDMTTGH
jgi:hypothetical protein